MLVLSFIMSIQLEVVSDGVIVQVRIPFLHVIHDFLGLHPSVVTLLGFGPAPLWGWDSDEAGEGTLVVFHGYGVGPVVFEDGVRDAVDVALDDIEVGDEFAIHVCECLEFVFVHIHETFHDVHQLETRVVPKLAAVVLVFLLPIPHHVHEAEVSVDGNVRVNLGSVEVGDVRLGG